MKREIAYITFIDVLFLLLLSVSGMTEGVLSEIIYYLAFVIPISVGFLFIRMLRSDANISFKTDGQSAIKFIPLIFPAVTVIFSVSLLTTVIINSIGFTNDAEINEPLLLAIILHALIPAVLEELLFRYIPLKLSLNHSPRWAVLLSALFFSLIHVNLFTIPYAFIAGVLFALVDIMAGSIIPSVILHFINNTLSVIFMMYFDETSWYWFFTGLLVLSAISAAAIFARRKKYSGFFAPLTDAGEAKEFSLAPLSLIIITLAIAITNLFSK